GAARDPRGEVFDLLSSGEDLQVRTAHIDDQNIPCRSPRASALDASTASWRLIPRPRRRNVAYRAIPPLRAILRSHPIPAQATTARAIHPLVSGSVRPLRRRTRHRASSPPPLMSHHGGVALQSWRTDRPR